MLFLFSNLTQSLQIHRLRWLPPPSAPVNSDSDISSIKIHALNPSNPPDFSPILLTSRSFRRFQCPALHGGTVSCIDLQEDRLECVSVGEDGRVNPISVGDSSLSYSRFYDSKGLVCYTAAKWGSPTEFATGGLGFSIRWWDQRKPGGPASLFKIDWDFRLSFCLSIQTLLFNKCCISTYSGSSVGSFSCRDGFL